MEHFGTVQQPESAGILERYVVQDCSDTTPTFVEHLARYDFAKTELKKGMEVLDAACGSGYGSYLLAQHGCRVTGGDISTEAVAMANQDFHHDRLNYQVLDVTHLDVADQSFDAYVSFETIEHFANQEEYLLEAARVVKRDGLFLSSTPNKSVHDFYRAQGWMQPNPYHVKELQVEEFRDLLERHFQEVRLYSEKLDPLWQLALELRRQVSELQWQLDRLPATFLKSFLSKLRKGRERADSKSRRPGGVTLDMIKIGATYLDKSDVVIAVCRRPRVV